MMINVVVEEGSDARLLERVLPSAKDACVRLVEGGTGRSALSMASSVRGSWREPVILLLDARTVDPENIQTQRENREHILTFAGPPLRAELVFAVPELEVVLFEDPALLENALGVRLTDEDRVEARFIPKTVLARLVEKSGRFTDSEALIESLDEGAARRIAEHPLIRQLEALIADVRANPVSVPELLRRTG